MQSPEVIKAKGCKQITTPSFKQLFQFLSKKCFPKRFL